MHKCSYINRYGDKTLYRVDDVSLTCPKNSSEGKLKLGDRTITVSIEDAEDFEVMKVITTLAGIDKNELSNVCQEAGEAPTIGDLQRLLDRRQD